jgi:hypothetical protein
MVEAVACNDAGGDVTAEGVQVLPPFVVEAVAPQLQLIIPKVIGIDGLDGLAVGVYMK